LERLGGVMTTNGNGGRKWTVWMAGIIASFITVTILFMGRGVVANEKACRDRDENIERRVGDIVKEGFKEMHNKMDDMVMAQNKMKVSIKGIEKDVEYLKGN